MLRRNKAATTPSSGVANPYEGLRARALAAVEEGLAPPDPAHPSIWGVVIDLPVKKSTSGYTIVALGDGTTNLHGSTGQTVTGSDDEASRAAAEALLVVLEHETPGRLAPDKGKQPRPDQARFHVLGADGLQAMDVPRDQVWGEEEGGGAIVSATQDLIRCLRRLASPEAPAD